MPEVLALVYQPLARAVADIPSQIEGTLAADGIRWVLLLLGVWLVIRRTVMPAVRQTVERMVELRDTVEGRPASGGYPARPGALGLIQDLTGVVAARVEELRGEMRGEIEGVTRAVDELTRVVEGVVESVGRLQDGLDEAAQDRVTLREEQAALRELVGRDPCPGCKLGSSPA